MWNEFLPSESLVMAKKSKPAAAPTPAPLGSGAKSLAAIAQCLTEGGGCQGCKLAKTRTKIVVGEGNPTAKLVFVGEGPGEQEDLSGRPFVGRAGQLLEKMIQALGLQREDVFICNVVKCRPPENRNPEPDEIAACSGYLHQQLDSLKPEVIVALGKFASQTLLQTEERISSLRGRFHPYRGTMLMPTFHPAYLLRNPGSKREAWSDLLQVAKKLGIQPPQRPPTPSPEA